MSNQRKVEKSKNSELKDAYYESMEILLFLPKTHLTIKI
jgi:hypothetical protein